MPHCTDKIRYHHYLVLLVVLCSISLSAGKQMPLVEVVIEEGGAH